MKEQESAYIAIPLAYPQGCAMETPSGPCGLPADWQICLSKEQWLPICPIHMSQLAREYQARISKEASPQTQGLRNIDTEELSPGWKRNRK
ncbi:MAG: hypothetical protein JOZ18_15125 [Chloroflexi bacterium]|nr:hypothetical protein [Chloroflexota bacterium]